jgi:hypothetical protein
LPTCEYLSRHDYKRPEKDNSINIDISLFL